MKKNKEHGMQPQYGHTALMEAAENGHLQVTARRNPSHESHLLLFHFAACVGALLQKLHSKARDAF